MSISDGWRQAPLPPFAPRMRIGLFGGTFDPPHAGHLLASLTALRRLGLDRVWWLVTPGNPLKSGEGLAPLAAREAAARALATDARIVVTSFEASLGLRYSIDAIAYLRRRAPQTRFVWIMGADNLAGLHRWRKWRDIARLAPIVVVDRPGSTLRAANMPAGRWLARWRAPESEAGGFADRPPPAFLFLHGPRSALSSTELRRAAGR